MRIRCPDEERLADYAEGNLSEKDRSQLEEHLADCQICLEGLLIAENLEHRQDLFELDPVPAAVTEAAVCLVTGQHALSHGSSIERFKRSVRNIVSRVSDTLHVGLWARWHLAPIRGSKTVASEDLVCLRVPFMKIETELEIEKTGDDRAHIRVKLPEAYRYKKTARVTLKKGEREVASYLSGGAYVLFEDIPFGHYGISLDEDGVRLGTYLFEIKETPHGGR